MDSTPFDDQLEEIEALSSIFASDFLVLEPPVANASGPHLQLTLSHDDPAPVRVRITITCPAGYPGSGAAAPKVSVFADEGLSGAQREKLQRKLEAVVKENEGGPVGFVVHSEALEYLTEGMEGVDEDTVFETVAEEGDTETSEEQSKKLHGTPVTPETFAAWKALFDAEFAPQKSEAELAAEQSGEVRLSGRQLFEQSKAIISEDQESFWEMEADNLDDASSSSGEDEN
mmetsp:Transcript_5923/g.14420  ORF Transcript_5923/g.14420 Transcript_5923/m.14420 type:complete len:230 (+) Transcript_5923:134-823(+)